MPGDGVEPEHPAPSITLTKPAGLPAAPIAQMSDDNGTTTLGVLGLVAGLLGLAAGTVALIRSGRTTSV
jgi:hypothetical protein